MIYLDYSATTPVNKEVLETFNKVSEKYWANSNAPHSFGLEANKLVDLSKKQVIELLGLSNDYEVIFTSSATEANNLAILGYLEKFKGKNKHIITSKAGHPSVYNVYKKLEKDGFEVSYLPLNEFGCIDTVALKNILNKNTVLCSFLLVNNELGSFNDINKIKKIVKETSNSLLHVDFVQGVGKVESNFTECDVDFITLAGHKIFGLKGTGVLIKKKRISIEPILLGGYSESSCIAGTSNVASIVSFAKALRMCIEGHKNNYEKVSLVSKYLCDKLQSNSKIHLNVPKNHRVPHIFNVSVMSIKPETIVNALSKKDIYISTKSACSSKSINESRALKAMGYGIDISAYSLRISISHLTTIEEIDIFYNEFVNVIEDLCEKN